MNDIEKIVSAGRLYLASSFEDVFPNVQRSLTKPLEQVGAEERELLRACSVRAVKCLNDIRFVIKVFASDIAQQPLKHLFDWMQSKTGEVNLEKTKNARQPYLGEVLSELVTWKCESTRSEFDMLIEDKAQGDNDGWSKVWHLVPQELVTDTRALMLTLVCSAVSQFRHADRKPCLRLPSAAPHLSTEEAERGLREEGLLAKEACCIQNEKDDLTEKIGTDQSSSLSPSQVCAQKGCSSPLPW